MVAPGDDEDRGVRAGARRLLRELLEVSVRSEPQPGSDRDAEVLHDFRVAHRRARVLLKEYGKALGKPSRRLADAMRRLGRRTGPVRDFDVLAQRLGAADPARPGSGPNLLLEEIAGRRDAADTALIRYLESPRYAGLVATWESLCSDPIEAADDGRTDAFARWTLDRISVRFGRLAAASGAFDARTDDDAIHATRIQAKRLRYLLEFLVSHRPESRERVRPIVERLKRLQDRLGAYQDLRAHAELLRVVADDPAAPLAARVEAVRRAAALDARRLRTRRGVGLALARFTGSAMQRRMRVLARTGG